MSARAMKYFSEGSEARNTVMASVLDQQDVMNAMLSAQKQGKKRDKSYDGDSDGADSSRSTMSRSRSSSLPTHHTSKQYIPLHPSSSRVRKDAFGASGNPPDVENPTQAEPIGSTSFSSLGLSQPIISALGTINIKTPTEIQAKCIRPILEGRDCIGGAQTGSGKTLAFALPILERIARDPFGVFAVVLTPTRELAYQLTEQFLVVGRPVGLRTITIVGGMDTLSQAKELDSRPHVIVATPGRLCDLLRSDGQNGGKLGRVRIVVLDEADRMLTPTFAEDLAYLFSQMPAKRQTCLFTATLSDSIMELARRPSAHGKDPPFVHRVASGFSTVTNLKQRYLFIPSQIRDCYLHYLLLHPPDLIDAALRLDQGVESRPSKQVTPDLQAKHIPSTIIFAQRCATAHLLHLLLKTLDIPSVPLHSHLTQPQRLQSLARFRAGDVSVLVTTDVGSRGLDIPTVAMVINWDCPRRADDYVHRVGRTARAGRGGLAITVITERDVDLVKGIEDEISVKLEELILPESEVLESLNTVSVARRLATMEMHDSGFGERQAINKAKGIKRRRRDAAK